MIKMKKLKNYLEKVGFYSKKGPAYQCDIDYLTLQSAWYVKKAIILAVLNSGWISFTNIVTNINFGIQ